MKLTEFRKLPIIKRKEFKAMLAKKQNDCCAICGRKQVKAEAVKRIRNLYNIDRRFAIDHDHETDEIRGLLCQLCNMMLGFAGDNVEILQRAIYYLDVGIHESKPKQCLRKPR